MFRFSIRDLLWLTLVVAMGLGWFVREGELRGEATHANKRADRFRGIAGALEHTLDTIGWNATWEPTEVRLDCHFDPRAQQVVPLNHYKPSAPEE